jgi:glycosyltransferase involved in cell wall biosynthesis
MPEQGLKVVRHFAFRRSRHRSSVPEMFLYLLSSILPAMGSAKRFEPDVVHAHFAVPVGPIAKILKLFYRIPYVITLHGGDVPATGQAPTAFRLIKLFMPPILRSASSLVAVSQTLATQAKTSFPNLNFKVIPNGVDTEFYVPGEKTGGELIRLCFAGRFSEQKGLEYLIYAIKKIANKEGRKFLLEIIGDGPVRNRIQQLVKSSNLEDRISFSGWVERKRLSQKLSYCDIFVLPSLMEGMPISCLHAMACGCAIVATKVGGIPEVVKNKVNGILVPARDSQALADSLLHLIDDDSMRMQFGDKGREIVQSDFRWEKIARQYLEILESAVRTKTVS